MTLELSVPGVVETVDENFDVTILSEGRRPLDGSFVARRLARSEVIACAAPEYLERRGRPAVDCTRTAQRLRVSACR